LTSGLHSLDEREHTQWKAGIRAGNLYLNRGTTGAIVLRQPFGGMGRSCVGPGLKAGGPNYVAQFLTFEELAHPPGNDAPVVNEQLEWLRGGWRAWCDTTRNREAEAAATGPALAQAQAASGLPSGKALLAAISQRLNRAIASYDHWWRTEFSREHDHFRLLGQDNFRRYLPFAEVRVRVAPADTLFDIFARVCAARVTGARVLVSTLPDLELESVRLLDALTDSWAAAIEFVEETDEQLAECIRSWPAHANERIRYAAADRVPAAVQAAAAEIGVYLAEEPVRAEGRIELLWYLREQSLSHDYHRYGNLGVRTGEARQEPL
jgi:RHH-type proline utilization regulon transcriptional repressor/proline dehydrogenase/delta 1-pyrroline-5-carboxylate dehydrogenase